MSEVFVSYKRENLAAVGRLVEALRAEGIGVWWDQDIPPNAAWEETIERALAAAKLVIVAWSPAAVASENVKAEARGARTQGRLLQVFVEACEPPLFFGERQGVDLKHWSGAASDAGFRSLLEAVRSGLKAPPTPVQDDVMAIDAAPPLPSKPSIAVMPFANLSGDPEQEYFADGMVEEIVTALSRCKSIFVIGSGSTLSFKGKAVSPHEAGRQLGVRYVLEGSVRKAGARVRITAKLTDASDGAQIWADRFEDTLDDIFALQDRVALSVGSVIEPAVRTAEIRRTARRPTENLGSYDLYLRASVDFLSFIPEKALASLALLERAIELDPDFGPAMARAAQICMFVFGFGWSDDPRAYRRRGVALANRAIAVAGDDADVLVAAANTIQVLERNLDNATSLIDRALELNPGASLVWYHSGMLKVALGEPDLAIQHLETSRRLDPLSALLPAQRMWIAIARFQQGRFAETVQLLSDTARQVSPNAPAYLTAAYGQLGMKHEAEGALAFYREWTSTRIKTLATGRPEHIKLFLDGIAVAEGVT
jgi:TolB-like protein